MNDTIASISTSSGVGAISIIRVSGSESIDIVEKIVKIKGLKEKESHTINYNFIVDNDELIDEVLISIMKAPKTFTTEDIVEINCHGGIATTNRILELLLMNGCRVAEPGEFTKRAFLNGRIDLVEAEAVMDLINSKTESSRKLAINQVKGNTSSLISNLRKKIVEIIANVEVNIDYPEYDDIEEVNHSSLKVKIEEIEQEIKKIIKRSENERYIKEGIKVALVGKPNVGKSSLLNALIEQQKAIVTPIAGTTRDIVEGVINLDGILLNIIDTAGIRKTEDIVEKIGVDKSKEMIREADLVLFILNNNEVFDLEDEQLYKLVSEKKHIIVINKNDLDSNLDTKILENENIIKISALNEDGINDLKNKIKHLFNIGELVSKDLNYLVNSRAVALLKTSLLTISDIKEGIKNNLPIDMIEIDLKNVWNCLGMIIGQSYEDELIDQLFSQFCLGK